MALLVLAGLPLLAALMGASCQGNSTIDNHTGAGGSDPGGVGGDDGDGSGGDSGGTGGSIGDGGSMGVGGAKGTGGKTGAGGMGTGGERRPGRIDRRRRHVITVPAPAARRRPT